MVSCVTYDYIEIACLYKLPIKLVLKDHSSISGTANDIKRNETQQECIEIFIGEYTKLVEVVAIESMIAEIPNPHFSTVQFS